LKNCSKCKKKLRNACFSNRKKARDGLYSWCKNCDNEYGYQKSYPKFKFVYQYLSTHPCVDCNEQNPIKLEFDHIKGKKIANISKMMEGRSRYSIRDIELEIRKCEVRCAGCHRIKTIKHNNGAMLRFLTEHYKECLLL